jgi:hypothetical protein
MQARFRKLGFDWHTRLVREGRERHETAKDARALLGHARATTTDAYLRRQAGARVQPTTRETTGKPGQITGKVSDR